MTLIKFIDNNIMFIVSLLFVCVVKIYKYIHTHSSSHKYTAKIIFNSTTNEANQVFYNLSHFIFLDVLVLLVAVLDLRLVPFLEYITGDGEVKLLSKS